MAGSSFVKKLNSQTPAVTDTRIPLRATRQLEAEKVEREELHPNGTSFLEKVAQELPFSRTRPYVGRIVDEYRPQPLQRHQPWLMPLVVCMILAITTAGVLLTASMLQRHGDTSIVNFQGGKAYDISVGGNLAGSWEGDQPLKPKVPLPTNPGPYSVLGKPSLTVDFMNQVLVSYNSPAAGKAQALSDLGVKYDIDPAFALAFFLHESTFGTLGEARTTLSLGNLRCIPNAACINTSGGDCQAGQSCYAAFPNWESGFEAWYKLIRNLYVAQWGLTTIDQIIPKYAPNADHNNEAVYISSLKGYLDSWHSGIIRP